MVVARLQEPEFITRFRVGFESVDGEKKAINECAGITIGLVHNNVIRPAAQRLVEKVNKERQRRSMKSKHDVSQLRFESPSRDLQGLCSERVLHISRRSRLGSVIVLFVVLKRSRRLQCKVNDWEK